MAIILSIDSVFDILASLYTDECFALGESSGDLSLVEFQKAIAERNNGILSEKPLMRTVCNAYMATKNSEDESFIRLFMEHLLKVGTHEDFSRIMEMYEMDEAKEELGSLYSLFWGPLPEGPPPLVRIVQTVRKGQGQASNLSQDWSWMREAIYGPPPYHYQALRKVALEPFEDLPEIPQFPKVPLPAPISGKGWIAESERDRIKLTWLSGAHAPQELSVYIPLKDLVSLLEGAKFNEVVTPLMRAQNVRPI